MRELKERVIRPHPMLSMRSEEQRASIPNLPSQEIEEGERGGIGPVEVVGQDQKRPGVARLAQQGGQAVEHSELQLVWVERLFRPVCGSPKEFGHEMTEVIGCRGAS